ncbi:TRAP transporter large permease [Haladaptatus pallidirubidus]|uniref:TRAP transporter large permease n=1 Tax=Haladaptatus pallidirubidus TaxID=1008152 RepID=A0AAV3UNN9_9EURY|nr:TRAP transporter large permease [Haladaptatus pallidirubidus]
MSELLVLSGLLLGVLLVLYALGVPVAIAMGSTVVIVMLSPYGNGINYGLIAQQLLYGLNSFTMLAIPFYLLLGRLMNRIGMTQRIFDLANSMVGQFRGGIAHVNIIASMIFSGMSGLAVADAAGLGRVEYAAMRDQGYEKDISLGVTGSSAIIGPIIPPSVPIIIYAVLAGESIGQLFMGGVVPGILIGLFLMVLVFVFVYLRGYETEDSFSLARFWSCLKSAVFPLLAPVLIVGGIVTGLFTATEAGAIAVVYTVLLGAFIYNELTLGELLEELQYSMVETFSLTFIVGIASMYGLVALQLRLPILMADQITGFSSDPTVVMLLLVGVLLIVGTFMETIAAITILVPIFLPILDIANIDPIHFGIVMILTLMLGLLTPPFGVILFVLEKVTDASLEEVMRAIVPYYVPILLALLFTILFPEIVMYPATELMGG